MESKNILEVVTINHIDTNNEYELYLSNHCKVNFPYSEEYYDKIKNNLISSCEIDIKTLERKSDSNPLSLGVYSILSLVGMASLTTMAALDNYKVAPIMLGVVSIGGFSTYVVNSIEEKKSLKKLQILYKYRSILNELSFEDSINKKIYTPEEAVKKLNLKKLKKYETTK